MSPLDRARLPLRVSVLISGLIGLFALGTANLLSAPTTFAVVVCFLAASAAPLWLSSPEEARLRRGASVAVLLLVGGYALHSAAAGLGDDPLLAIGPILALLLCGLQVAHALVLNTRRDLLVGLTIGLFMTVLAAGLSPGPAVALPLLVGWPVAVTALVLAYRLEAHEDGYVVAGPRRADQRSTRALVASTSGAVAITMAAGLIVFLLLPQPAGLSARSRLLGGSNLDSASTDVRGAGYYSGGIMDLRTRGSLSDSPVLDVPADSPPLWRGTVLSSYDGQAWFGTTDSLIQMNPAQGPTYAIPHPLDTILRGQARTDPVTLLSDFSGTVVAPGPIESITIEGRLLRDTDGGLLATGRAGAPLSSYVVTSVPEVTDAGVLAAAKGADPRDPRWLQLPATLPQRVSDLALQITGGKASRYEQVRAVEDYLRTHEKYQLDSPVPAPGADAVDDFLFVSNSGFCEQFASAEVILLRSRGVPARMVTGLAYGHVQDGGLRRMLVSDAHAWVEVWYPGIGWSSSDPTAGSALATGSGTSLLARLVHATLDSAGKRAVAALAVGLLAAALTFGLRWWLGRRPERVRVPTAAPGPVLAAFRRLEVALVTSGRPRKPAESIGELRRRLPEEGSAALTTLEQECYGAAPPTEDDTAAAVRTLDELARTLAEVTGR
jgi:transglutaminase-like putative cysteine protease